MSPMVNTLAPITPTASPERGVGSGDEIRHPPTRYSFSLMAGRHEPPAAARIAAVSRGIAGRRSPPRALRRIINLEDGKVFSSVQPAGNIEPSTEDRRHGRPAGRRHWRPGFPPPLREVPVQPQMNHRLPADCCFGGRARFVVDTDCSKEGTRPPQNENTWPKWPSQSRPLQTAHSR